MRNGVKWLRDAASEYARQNWRRFNLREYIRCNPYVAVPEQQARYLADLFETLPHTPQLPRIQRSYAALARELLHQWDVLRAFGLEMRPFQGEGEPYANSAAMLADVRENRRLYFLPTAGAFGETGDASDRAAHPLLASAGVTVDGVPLLLNDVFRAVHDAFGHAAEGFEFGPRGEHNAWIAHARMFSREARLALAIETRAQNSWVNYGAHLRRPDGSLPRKGDADYVPLSERPFAPQKLVDLPDAFVHPPIP